MLLRVVSGDRLEAVYTVALAVGLRAKARFSDFPGKTLIWPLANSRSGTNCSGLRADFS